MLFITVGAVISAYYDSPLNATMVSENCGATCLAGNEN